MNGKWSIYIIFLFIVFTISSAHQDLNAGIINRVVAIVDDEVITLYELNQKIQDMTGMAPEDIRIKDEEKYLETRKNILELMIDDKIAQKKIQELGIMISQAQIDAAIEDIKKNNRMTQDDLLNGLKSEGLTYEKYRETIKTDLERNRLINSEVKSKILIREEQILQYYQDHQKDFSNPEQVQLAGIFLNQKDPKDEDELRDLFKKAENILVQLNNAKTFSELAKAFSEGPGADEGGNLGTIKTDQLDETLRTIIDNMPEGGVSQPIHRGNGVQIFKLLKRVGGKGKPFEEVRDSIYEILYRDEINKRYMTWIKDLRESVYTKIIF
jgi:peptidyl-prolyl cis-trans isomerase SurA